MAVLDPRAALDELMKVYQDQARYLERADRYYRAQPSSVNIGTKIPPSLAKFRTAWPAVRVATNAFADRVKLEDVMWPKAQDRVEDFREELTSSLNQAVVEALATGIGYLRVVNLGNGEVNFQAIRGRDGAFLEDPDTAEVSAVMRIHRPPYYENKEAIHNPQRVTVYVPGAWARFSINPSSTRAPGDDYWTQEDAGVVPDNGLLMRPLINRARASEPYGRAEAKDLYALQDQGSRNLTNMGIVADDLAIPQRVLIAALPESLSDLSELEAYKTSILALSGDVKVDQWNAAQLQPFVEAAMMYGRKASETSGIPLSYWGISAESQGAGGDAIRENDARLVIRSLELCGQWTRDLIAIAKVVANLMEVKDPGRVAIKWANPATPTPAAEADAALKLTQIGAVNGQIVVDREMIWNILRIPPEERDRIKELEESAFFQELLREQQEPEPGPEPPDEQ